MTRVLIGGMSTRAAAESAARAGFDVTAIDAYADRDQHPSVRARCMSRDFSARPTATGIARAARSVDCDSVIYLSPFENHPGAVAALAAGRVLWGNPPDILRRVRNPSILTQLLREHGFAVPRVRSYLHASNDPNDPNDWFVKPLRSGGGHRIRAWRGGTVPRTCYLQERIDGMPGSIVFVAAGGKCVPLGLSRQLSGDSCFGAGGNRYCGSIIAPADELFVKGRSIESAALALAQCIAAEFHLLGLNGIDFVARDGIPYPVEVNPRWSSSMELAEKRFDLSLFSAHADASAAGALPVFDLPAGLRCPGAVGKAVIYARHNGPVGDTSGWIDDPDVRDVPRSGESFRTGQPVCTVFAAGANASVCYRALTLKARDVYAQLDAWRSATTPACAVE